jgi:hypothetical protein
MPREIRFTADLPLTGGLRVLTPGGDSADGKKNIADQFAAQDLLSTLKERGVNPLSDSPSKRVTVTLLHSTSPIAQAQLKSAGLGFTPAMLAEGYIMLSTDSNITIIGNSEVGIFYGVQTLKQLISTVDGTPVLHAAVIRDWPAMQYRGLQDDLSRGSVPTIEYQKKQIRTLAEYKINIYSPYFENTFAYSDGPLLAPAGAAFTPDDARALVAYAAQYHITIIPQQEAFGHLHHVLLWEQYSALAETPHGQVLAPGQPASLDLISSWFTQLAAVFPAPMLHIGADETTELGTGQTQADVTARGLGPVYLDFLSAIHQRLLPLHRRLLFWGDIAMGSPDLIAKLPPDMLHDMIAVPWWYLPEPKGYAKYIKPFTSAGMETWVSPGVNNWSRVWPNFGMGLSNIQGFARDGQQLGATGLLNTVWNDDGEGLFEMDWYGVLFGAAAAWQPGESSLPQFQQSFGEVFHGDESGKINQAQVELIAAHALLKETADVGDGSDGLFWIDPWSTDGMTAAAKVRPVLHDVRMHAERALTLIAEARTGQNLRETDALDAMELGARRLDFIGLKFQLADEMILSYQRALAMQHQRDKRPDVLRELNNIDSFIGRCQDLRDGYSLLRDLYQQAWLRENRPYWLQNVLARYDLSTQLWLGRMDRIRSAQRQWTLTHTLPPATDIGIPSEIATASVK